MATKVYGRKAGETQPCYLTHKKLSLGLGTVIGGRCGNPIVEDADVYISFDAVSHPFQTQAFPWTTGESFCYPIVNMKAPEMPEQFIALVQWSASFLSSKEGAVIHCGCIGGHGRTGIYLAALVAWMEPEGVSYTGTGVDSTVDALHYVREHYCPRAVETKEQVDFLGEYFSVTPAEPYYETKARLAKAKQVQVKVAGKVIH